MLSGVVWMIILLQYYHHLHSSLCINNDIIITITTTISISSYCSYVGVLIFIRVCNFCSRFILDGTELGGIELDGLGIAGRVWISGISGLERDGWIPPSPSPLQLVYRLDVVDDGGLILFSFVFLVRVLILDGV